MNISNKFAKNFKFITMLLITLTLSSCALLDRLQGGVPDMLLLPPSQTNLTLETPIATEDVRG